MDYQEGYIAIIATALTAKVKISAPKFFMLLSRSPF
jgi:hypothetical protein